MPLAFGATALAATSDDSSPSDILVVLLIAALVVGVMYAAAAIQRAKSRRAHVDVATTGQGAWVGTISSDDLIWLFPGAPSRGIVSVLLSNGTIPVTLRLDPDGLRLELSGRLVRRTHPLPWSAPWSDIVGAASTPVGFRTLEGKLSVVRLTDVLVTVVGPSAQEFLEFWAVDDADVDEEPLTPEELAEEAGYLEEAKRDLGPAWIPGTALLRIRMSAVDGLTEAISRWARGHAPQPS